MIPDKDILQQDNIPGPTKEEIRCLVRCKSQVQADDVVVEVGCGTGGLTLEFAQTAYKVYSIDKNQEAVDLTQKNLLKFGLQDKVELMKGSAPEIFSKLPSFDVLMVGGSSGNLKPILKKGYRKLKNKGRIIVTAILLETRYNALKTLEELGLEVDMVEVFIAQGKHIKPGTMMQGLNPVAIITAQK